MAVTDTATHVTGTMVTTASGDYSVPYLPSGTYTISAEYRGFRPPTVSSVVLPLAQTVRADIRMELARMQATGASATPIALNTDTPLWERRSIPSRRSAEVLCGHPLAKPHRNRVQ